MKEKVRYKHDGGHYEWVTVTLKSGDLKVRRSEMVNTHYPKSRNTNDDTVKAEAIGLATAVARSAAQVAMAALREATK